MINSLLKKYSPVFARNHFSSSVAAAVHHLNITLVKSSRIHSLAVLSKHQRCSV